MMLRRLRPGEVVETNTIVMAVPAEAPSDAALREMVRDCSTVSVHEGYYVIAVDVQGLRRQLMALFGGNNGS